MVKGLQDGQCGWRVGLPGRGGARTLAGVWPSPCPSPHPVPSEGFNQGVMRWDLHFERQLSGSEVRVGFGDRSVGGPHVLD